MKRLAPAVLIGLIGLASTHCGGSVNKSGAGGGTGAGASGGQGGSGGVAPSGGGSSGSGGFTGDCCTSHASPGCADGATAACVCAKDPYCCDGVWDATCVDGISTYGCGSCGGGTGGVSGSGGIGGTGAFGGTGGTTLDGGGGGGFGGAPACNPAACKNWNAPTCCLSPFGPCGVLTNLNTCVTNICEPPQSPCAACQCTFCAPEVGKCMYYSGCDQVLACMHKFGCNGPGCYTPATCQPIIDQNGGPGGEPFVVASVAAQCAQQGACVCP